MSRKGKYVCVHFNTKSTKINYLSICVNRIPINNSYRNIMVITYEYSLMINIAGLARFRNVFIIDELLIYLVIN